jgi:hypothetical protein
MIERIIAAEPLESAPAPSPRRGAKRSVHTARVKVTSSPSRLTRRELEIALHRKGDGIRREGPGPGLQSAAGCRTIPRADGLASRIAAVRAHGAGRLRISAQDGLGAPGCFIRIVRGSRESAVFLWQRSGSLTQGFSFSTCRSRSLTCRSRSWTCRSRCWTCRSRTWTCRSRSWTRRSRFPTHEFQSLTHRLSSPTLGSSSSRASPGPPTFRGRPRERLPRSRSMKPGGPHAPVEDRRLTRFRKSTTSRYDVPS